MNSALALPTSLLFTDNTEVSILFVEFTKATPASEKHAKSATRLSDSTLTQFELKSANPMPTMNSTSQNSKVDIWFTDFHPPLYGHNKVEVGRAFVDFSPPFSSTPSSLLNSASSEVGIGFVDFNTESPRMLNSR